MRNLKKFLALVLAMVMAFSLMLSASAATSLSGFQDADKVTPEFVESVTILAGLDVIKGDGDEDNKTIRPQDEITRAEAAALVYRIVTGDVNDRQVQLYSDYGKFADVNSGDWFAGYVGYCQNAGIIKGTTPTTFSPYLKVTGYEVLAMILRAVGYGKNNEFTGSSWQVNVASLGKTKHITDSISSAQYNYTLNMNARREIVAELLFRGAMIPQVTWTAIGGYNERTTLLGNEAYNDSLAIEVFGLSRDGWRYGSWGRPELVWSADLNPTGSREVAVLPAAASHEFTDLKRECDVAEMLDITSSDTFVLFVDAAKRTATNPITIANGAVTDAYRIVATDTVTKVGGYGRLTEIYLQDDMDKQYPYYSYWSYWSTTDGNTAPTDTFVMIDTYLAKVVSTAKPVLDTAGHVITPARMTVELYDNNVNVVDRRTIQKPDGSKDEWEYSAGDVLSLKGVSDQTAVASTTKDETWAFTLPTVGAGTRTNTTQVLKQNTHVFDITKLEGTQGKQTTVYWNNGKHQVDGQDKTDDLALRMDKAGSNIDTTYTWYYDAYGYLLGIDDGGKVNYGVITSIYVSYGANESTDGVAKAVASVKYADGTTGTETIDYFLVNSAVDAARRTVKTAGNITESMKDITTTAPTAANNVIQLWPAYNLGSNLPMVENDTQMPFNGTTAPSPVRGVSQGTVYMAPVALSNKQASTSGVTSVNKHGILDNNLFKFVKSAGDKTVAIEVAGGQADGTYPVNASGTPIASTVTDPVYNGGSQNQAGVEFGGHWAEMNVTNTSGNVGKVNKSLSYITVGHGTTDTDTITWLDNDTQIMVRNEQTGVITCYDGVSNLPGNVTISTTSGHKNFNEIDWADTDNDGRADVVYLTGSIDGVTTYGLFYTNDLTASWDGSKAVMHGFWNGEETDVTFTSLEQFNQVKNVAVTGSNGYKGHLFALQQIAGVVTNVMIGENENDTTNHDYALLYETDAAANTSGTVLEFDADQNGVTSAGANPGDYVDNIRLSTTTWGSSTVADYFRVGTANGNPYSAATKAVYYSDSTTVGNRVVYNASSNWTLLGATVTTDVDGQTYRLTPNSKVYGIGSNVVLAEGVTALEYLNHSSTNDVTIVHENNSVIEMYIQTDPNITPSNPGVVAGSSTAPSIDSALPDALKAGGWKITGGSSARDNYMKQLPDGVHQSAYDMSGSGDVINAETTIYIKYTSTASLSATLTIYDASNNVVYSSGAPFTSTTAGGHYFYLTLNVGDSGDTSTAGSNTALYGANSGTCSGVWGANGLPAGTYTYTITGSGITSGDYGSFTVL